MADIWALGFGLIVGFVTGIVVAGKLIGQRVKERVRDGKINLEDARRFLDVL